MKYLRISALILGGLLIAFALLVSVALIPAVQTWALRKALSGRPDLTLEIEKVSAGFSQTEVKGLRLAHDGSLITAERVVASYSLWDYLAGRGIHVDQTEIQGLVVDLRHSKPSPATPAPKPSSPFQGVFPLLRLPMDLTVNRMRAECRVLLPENRTALVTVEGLSIATGQTGTLSWKIDFTDDTAGAAVRHALVEGRGTVSVTADARIDRIELQTSATPQGPGMSGETLRFDLTAAQPTAGDPESFKAGLGLVRPTGVESLVAADLTFSNATRILSGDWNVSAGAGQLRAILKDLGLPEFSASGKGQLSLATDSGEASATGKVQARLADVRSLSPELPSIGAIDAQGEFSARYARDVMHLDRFALTVLDSGGRSLVELNALQPLAFDLTTQRATLSRPSDPVARVSANALPLAWAQTWVAPRRIESGELSATLEIKASADGSQFALQAVEPLAVRQLTLRDGDAVLLQQASVSVRPTLRYERGEMNFEFSQLQIGLSATETIAGSLGGQLRLATASAPLSVSFSTDLNGKVGPSLKAWLPIDPGNVEFVFATQGSHQGDRLDVAKASLQITGESNVARLGFELLQPVQVGLKEGSVASARPAETLARVTLGELPLPWAAPWIKGASLAGSVSGGVVEIALRSRDDLTAVTTTALNLKGVSLSQGGKPLIQSLDTSADFTVTLKGDLLTYDLRRLEGKEGASTLASLRAAGSVQLGKTLTATSNGNLNLDLPALLRQPALASYAAISRGAVILDFTASTGAAHQAKVALVARDLVATSGNTSLGRVETTLDLTLDAEGRGKVVAPVRVMVQNRVTDFKLDASYRRSADSTSIQGLLTGDQVILDDLQAFSRVAPPAAVTAPTPAPTRPSAPTGPRPGAPAPAPDTQPAWKGLSGDFDVKLKRVVYGKDYPVQGLEGRLKVTENRVAVEGLKGRLKENPFSVTAAVTFDAKRPLPYALTGKAQVENLDIGEILRSANPSEKPALETKATVLANLGGQGANLNQLFQNTTGTFDLSGGKGVIRALGRKGQVAGAASLLLGVLGAQQGSNTTMAVAELASVLNELTFTQFKVRVERGADLNLNVPTLEFTSPTARLTGTGRIAHQAGVPIQNQALNFELKLAGKDSLAFLLNRAGVLSGTKDDQEYFPMTTAISLGGTPGKPDASQFWRLLGQTALGGLLR